MAGKDRRKPGRLTSQAAEGGVSPPLASVVPSALIASARTASSGPMKYCADFYRLRDPPANQPLFDVAPYQRPCCAWAKAQPGDSRARMPRQVMEQTGPFAAFHYTRCGCPSLAASRSLPSGLMATVLTRVCLAGPSGLCERGQRRGRGPVRSPEGALR